MKRNFQDGCTGPVEGRLAEIALAARELIAERGFEGLRTREIAARVGINVATLHYHVPTKEALIRIVAQSLRSDFIAQSTARPREGMSPVEVLKMEFADFRETLLEAPERYIVMAELSDRAERDEAVAAEILPMRTHWRQMVAKIIMDGRDQGLFRADIDPEAAAMMVIGTMSMSFWHARGNIELFDRACAELLRSLLVHPPKD